ncbi:hypothetical protein BC835DRAFT_1406595 [Cytidiella melzeri]|nr:hypothetical protein BC835DRAFT_1406595 [Cytidiella melzeri]
MSETTAEPSKDSLGLDLDSLKINDDQTTQEGASASAAPAMTPSDNPVDAAATVVPESPAEPNAEDDKRLPPREKKKPYVNPERVKTGGAQREKLSEEELAQRMVRIREQNEKIKQRRIDVEADEQEFKKTQEEERIKQARDRKVQQNVDRMREQNARRKLDKIQNREWDSGKPGVKRPISSEPPSNVANQPPPQTASIGIRGGVRGGGGGRGRGRGRGGNTAPTAPERNPFTSPVEEKPAEAAAAPASSS